MPMETSHPSQCDHGTDEEAGCESTAGTVVATEEDERGNE
jgi:hypothetical protein